MYLKHKSEKEQKQFADQDTQYPAERKLYSYSSETI